MMLVLRAYGDVPCSSRMCVFGRRRRRRRKRFIRKLLTYCSFYCVTGI